ncbi:MAG: hypothetical protein E6G55_08220 [Actinobacteria bacterium]|nr:MAG: hypothetical protein E6G55_08220 [Actinomycetota bacterium]
MPDPFSWHPEPELIGFRDPGEARAALEELGRLTWGSALDWLYEDAMRRPVPTESYPEMRRKFFGSANEPAPPPEKPAGSSEVLAEFRERVAPFAFSSQHPGSYSYFTPPPLPMSIAGEVLAQWLNQGVDVWAAGPIGAFVEEEVTAWLRELVGFGEGSWGVLTSGGVMANIMALAAARDVHLAVLLGRSDPPRGSALEGVRVYASDQAHFSIERGLSVLGFPPETLRIVPSDERFRLQGGPVAEAVAEDRASGLLPFAIAAVSGSTNTGSVDLVGELADIAERERMWLHVDAAYGGGARFSKRDAGRVPDLERADFHREPEYYRYPNPEDAPLNWMQYSIEGTRRFRALKLWTSWKHLGTEGFGRLIEHNDDLAAYLVTRCNESGEFEVVPDEPELSVVCFRHIPPELDPSKLDAYQDRLQRALELSGKGWVSTTKLRGRTYLRAGVVNYLSTEADVDRVLDALRRLSKEAAAGV